MQQSDPFEPDLLVLKSQLIPNLQNLDPHVQKEVLKILRIIIQPECSRELISQISKMNLLEQVPLLRSHIWKILIGTIQIGVNKWKHDRDKNHSLYCALKQKFCSHQVSQEDINEQQKNQQQNGFDKYLWNQIALDTRRTHSTINFFQSQVFFTKVYKSRPTKHSDILSRILYIWSKTNPSVRYVQGMNQILAPLYYLQFQWINSSNCNHNYQSNSHYIMNWDRESQVFAMFATIMSFIIDMHIKQMDDCDTGILGRMVHLNRFLKVADPQLWIKLQTQGIFPECYSFRWLALLLAQQFGLYDTMRLWDHVLSFDENNRFFYIYCLCIAVLKLRRKTIMAHDFTISLPVIQKLRDMDIDEVVDLGTQIFQKYKDININNQFQKSIQKDAKQKKITNKSKTKAQQIHLSSGSWSYSDILAHTTNYLSKLTSYATNKY